MTKKRWFFWARVLTSLSLLGYLIFQIDIGSVLGRYEDIQLTFVVLAIGILLLQQVLSTVKWILILRTDGVKLPFGFLLKTYFIGSFISLFLPTSFGGDLYRIYRLKGPNTVFAKSTSSVLFDRLSGLFALGSIALVATIFLPENPYRQTIFLFYLVALAGFLGLTTEAAIKWANSSRFSLLQNLVKILRSFRKYRSSPRWFGLILLIAFWFQLNIILVNHLYASALSIDIPFTTLMVIIPLIYLTEAVPLSINGLGIRDSAFVFFFGLVGNTAQEALAISLLIVAIRYGMGLIGGILLLTDVISTRRKTKNWLQVDTNLQGQGDLLTD